MLTAVGVSSTVWLNDNVVGTAVLLDVVLMTRVRRARSIALYRCRRGRGERDALARAAAATFPLLYLGLPIGRAGRAARAARPRGAVPADA